MILLRSIVRAVVTAVVAGLRSILLHLHLLSVEHLGFVLVLEHLLVHGLLIGDGLLVAGLAAWVLH